MPTIDNDRIWQRERRVLQREARLQVVLGLRKELRRSVPAPRRKGCHCRATTHKGSMSRNRHAAIAGEPALPSIDREAQEPFQPGSIGLPGTTEFLEERFQCHDPIARPTIGGFELIEHSGDLRGNRPIGRVGGSVDPGQAANDWRHSRSITEFRADSKPIADFSRATRCEVRPYTAEFRRNLTVEQSGNLRVSHEKNPPRRD